MELYLKKIDNYMIPDDQESAAYLFQVKNGTVLRGDFKKPRNYEFHKKYFSLLNYAYDCFEIDVEYKGEKVEKNFDRFREDIQILAGYGEPTYNLNGEVRYKSKSISFGSMSDPDFEKLYSSVINVILKRIFKNYTRDDLEKVVEDVLRYA